MVKFMQSRTFPIDTDQRVALIHGPHDLRVESRAVPSPAQGEALVRVQAVGICGSDFGYLAGTSKYPVKAPFVIGHEASGVVVAVHPTIENMRQGLLNGGRVAIVPSSSCGQCEACRSGFPHLCAFVRYLGSAASDPHVDGALQQYICLPFDRLTQVPDTVSDAAAALLEPLAVAEHAVRRGDVTGRTVLIAGGGAIGQLLASCAKAAGAKSVTVCETQQRRRALALAHGADEVADPAEIERQIEAEIGYDVVLDATGNPVALDMCIRACKRGRGRLVVVGNLPTGSNFPAEAIRRAEIWVTATYRFPGGFERALALVAGGLDLDWLVEMTTDFDHLNEAVSAAAGIDPPLKIQIVPTGSDNRSMHHEFTKEGTQK
jgi:2-desacetyl-2-hydroxyethyl bacteriochlorophyllide A dehydrogenase